MDSERQLGRRHTRETMTKRYSKYRAVKVYVDGIRFDSRREAKEWSRLRSLEEVGEISSLRRQVPYTLIKAHREPDMTGPRGGVKKGKLIERPCVYIADFVYIDKDGNEVVEDVKSKATRTPEYIIKRKLMLDRLGIRIKEVD